MKRRKNNFNYQSVRPIRGTRYTKSQMPSRITSTNHPAFLNSSVSGTNNLILSAAKSDCSSLVIDEDLLTTTIMNANHHHSNCYHNSSALQFDDNQNNNTNNNNEDDDDEDDMPTTTSSTRRSNQPHHNLALLNPKQQQYNNYVTYAFVFHQTLVDLMRILYCLFYANNMYFEFKRYKSCFIEILKKLLVKIK